MRVQMRRFSTRSTAQVTTVFGRQAQLSGLRTAAGRGPTPFAGLDLETSCHDEGTATCPPLRRRPTTTQGAAAKAHRRQRSAPAGVETPRAARCAARARGPHCRRCTNRESGSTSTQNRSAADPIHVLRRATKKDIVGLDDATRRTNGMPPARASAITCTRKKKSGARRDSQRPLSVGTKSTKRHPARGGVPSDLSRPCCATRSGCTRQARPRPGGHRGSPETTDHRASPTGRAGRPC